MMKIFTLCALIAIGALALPAYAQWQWIDGGGKKVFSDRAPPADIPEKNITKRPIGSSSTSLPKPATSSVTGASAPKAAASSAKGLAKDTELEKRKAQTEAEDTAKKKAEDQKLAEAKADNCERSKRGLAALKSGMRMAQINAQGEREIMSDDARKADEQRLEGIVAADCKP
jgi:Domain of unknown function (DUF4124)